MFDACQLSVMDAEIMSSRFIMPRTESKGGFITQCHIEVRDAIGDIPVTKICVGTHCTSIIWCR